MAIAHIATEYVFSDFLLKEPPETRYKGLRLELALDKIVTCIAVGLPLLLISLAFAQEVSIGNSGAPLSRFPAAPAADKGLGGRGAAEQSGAPGGSGARLPAGLPLGAGQGTLPSRNTAVPERIPGSRLMQMCWAARPALPAPFSSLGHSLAAAVLSTPPGQGLCQPSRRIFCRGSDGSAEAALPFVSQRSSERSSQPGCTREVPVCAAPGAPGFGGRIRCAQLSGTGATGKGCQSSALRCRRLGGAAPPQDGQWESSLKLSAAPLPSCSCSRSVVNFCCDSGI